VRRAVTLLAVLALAVSVLPAGPAQADGPPPKRIVSGWIPYWVSTPGSPSGITSAVANADLLTDVSPFWYSATAKAGGGVTVRINPNFSGGSSAISWAMGQLRPAGLTILPAIADGSGKGRMAATLADPGLRAAHIADILALVQQGGFDGIDLDYETFAFSDGSSSWAATQPNWTTFVQELGAAMDAQGKLLSVTIPPPCGTSGTCGSRSGYWVYNMAAIAPFVDRIRIMAYDYHVQGIGPIAPMPWVRAIVAYSASVMDPAKLQIGVPTYGRAWTRRTDNGGYRLSGVCPTDRNSAAWRSATAMASVSGNQINSSLAGAGVRPEDIQWSSQDQEYFATYDKRVAWTDANGVAQTCVARRIMYWLGPQGVLARTQLVGEFGLSAAAFWTIGGEDPGIWDGLRAYGQSLAPATTDVTAAGVPVTPFGVPVAITATVASRGAPVTGVAATVQFMAVGTRKWVDVQQQPINPDGTVAFTVTPTGTGQWRVLVPAAAGRVEGTSSPFTTQVVSAVTATPPTERVRKGQRFTVVARALPPVARQSVVLQVKVGEEWRNVARDRANAKGRVRLVARAPDAKGRYTYRVVAVGNAAVLTAASPEFTVRVFR
jgi:spore germination protein YaaH